MKSRCVSLLFLAVLALAWTAAAPSVTESSAYGQEANSEHSEKSDLRVLFVGHDPAKPRMPFADMDNERTVELYKERTAAFKRFLEERFKSVTVVYGADYSVEQSDQVDVTIFDSRPKPLKAAVRGTDPDTGQSIYEPAEYLPMSFDRPAITIAENSPTIGEPLGLKLDWL